MRTPRSEIPRLLELSRDDDHRMRRKAIQALCPCEVKSHDPQIWDRFLEMADDPDPHVRRWIVHVLCDGSPSIYGTRILAVLEKFQRDPDERVKRRARKVLAAHRHSGTLNVL
ncbi:HEAT repeat domain-containing protein [Candidatus Binatus sp.]|uniref:HEAT repeat domain-containing protein n=1 Tax=Candidatus Binatus sp. TaxID=2811406 RepID=UPI003BAFB865